MSVSPKKPGDKWTLAVLASGNGTNLQAILDAVQAGKINAEVKAVISNKRHAFAISRGRNAGVETFVFEPEKFQSRTLMCSKMAKKLNELNIDLVVLAGYMLKLEPCMIRSFPNRIINIHPALLPKFGGAGMYGRHVHEAVIAAKEKESGCTVHLVDEIFDHGPVLAQARVSVSADDTADTLAEKIHKEEHALYTDVIAKICSGEINLDK